MSTPNEKKALSRNSTNTASPSPDSKNHNQDSNFQDLESLRLSQDFRDDIDVSKVLVQVPVRRPSRQEFVRVYDDEKYRMDTSILELKAERQHYLLAPSLRDALTGDWCPVRLVTTINRLGVLFLWPLKLTGPYGQSNPWYETGIEAANLATSNWIKVVADMNLGGYQSFAAKADLPEPVWPEHTFQELLEIAFRDHFIDTLDHPVVKQLLGEV